MPLDLRISLVTVEDAMLELGAPESELVRVERLINAASARVETFCDRIFKARDLVLTFDGDGSSLIDLGGPVQRVQTVSFLSQSAGVADTNLDPTTYQYVSHPRWGKLYRSYGWPVGVQNIQVIARVGEDPVPHDIKEAALMLVKHWYKDQGGSYDLQSERIADYSYTRFYPRVTDKEPDIPDEIKAMLLPHRRYSFL